MAILLRPLLVLLAFLIVVALILALLLGGFGGGGSSSDDGDDSARGGDKPAKQEKSRESSEGTISAANLKAGDCISDANSRTGDVTTFDAVKCDKPHDGEVYTLIELEGGPKAKVPSEAFINGKGQRGCRARLRRQATRRAFRDRQLGFKFVYPTPASWAEGDRQITCVATFKKPRDTKLAQR
ncbi:MAG: hypothetical protein QOI64_942 [Solirubrobacteraceae bacterium]|nr:hypothetical protein [Solirubrobacteraceae bacterium]